MSVQTPPKEIEELPPLPPDLIEGEVLLEGPEKVPSIRLSVAMAFSTFAAAVMVAGVFVGYPAYVWAPVAGTLGIVIGNLSHRMGRASLALAAALVGIFVIGLVLALSAGGVSAVVGVGALAREAATSGSVLRPPVEFTAGWRAISGWLMGAMGFSAAWVTLELKRPALGLLLPLPLVVIGAISVPDSAKTVSGLVAAGLFAAALGVLSTAQAAETRPSLAYELRRAARAVPMIGLIMALLWVLSRFNLLFPAPLYDPTQDAQRPRTVPLTEVEDRVLFTVDSGITGPWRMGLLDVYDGRDWRLPPFAQTRLREVPRSGVVDSKLVPSVRASFNVKGLGGAVLPGLPNTVGVVAEGPRLAYDSRTGNIRMAQGQIDEGLEYTVVAAKVPSVLELENVGSDFPDEVQEFLRIPDPPPAVERLVARAPTTSLWASLDFVRQELLITVTAKGEGKPVSIPPSRVQDMIGGSKEGSPFEIVAAQAMLARWVGVPSRIGYGFDGGDKVGNLLEVRPKHGSVFLEVYFTGYGWLPVLGNPAKSASALGTSPKQLAESILPSDEISLPIFVPIQYDPPGYLWAQVRRILSIALPIIAAALLIYYVIWPALRKVVIRGRRRTWAAHESPKARVALAYSEWRDLATDFGFFYPSDTPLMFLERVVADEEHTEFAWLTTRALWGDLESGVAAEDALAAEELSRALRKRLSQAQTATLRFVAIVSRMSLRSPYAPALVAQTQKRRTKGEKAA